MMEAFSKMMAGQPVGHCPGVGEVAGQGGVGEGEGGGDEEETGPEDDDEGAEDGVGALVVDPARGDALVDDVGLLEEQLPGGHRGAHDGDHEQDRGGIEPTADAGDDEAAQDGAGVGVGEHGQGDGQEIHHHEDEHEALPAAEAARGRDGHQPEGGQGDRDVGTDAEVAEGQAHADELGDDGEEVQDEEVADGEGPPEAAEALDDETGVADTGDGAQADDHLLVDDEDGDEQGQGPQQAEAVLLARLGVGGHTAGVVVAHHDDEAGPDDGEEGEEAGREGAAGGLVVLGDGAEGPVDVAAVRLVQEGVVIPGFEGLVGHVWTSRRIPASAACMSGAHARRRSASGQPRGVRSCLMACAP
jgi:hypothetical protein